MRKFSRILIASRGEIALRIIRACRELGIETVVVYSEADREAAYLRLANARVCIGPGPASESYLDIPKIISAAEITDAEAIHPGYGFLAENPRFAEICQSCHIEFIGPTVENIRTLGDKARAREIAKSAGIPVVPGSEGIVSDESEAIEIARSIGYPVIIKAASGGGGRGMRVAHNDLSLASGFSAARLEAESAFGNPDVYLEKYIEKPRHVEFQILADPYGSVVHLGERDCTIQRRHQKLIEEAPSPALTPELRRRMGEAARILAQAVGYANAGTVEFLLDADGEFYFMEVNTRIQVEHPVTEEVTGIDLIKEQIRIAAGEPLGYTQEDVPLRGAAIECRINAEDPYDGFKPSAGVIERFDLPGGPGVRVDTHAYAGYRIPPNYDSMIAKVIVRKENRDLAVLAMSHALEEFRVEGVRTTIPLHLEILRHVHFRKGNVDTGFVEEYFVG